MSTSGIDISFVVGVTFREICFAVAGLFALSAIWQVWVKRRGE